MKQNIYLAIYEDGALGVSTDRAALYEYGAAVVWVGRVVIGPKGGATIKGGFVEGRMVQAA